MGHSSSVNFCWNLHWESLLEALLGYPLNLIIETSMSAPWSTFLARSPADPMLDGNDDMSASKTLVSREALLLDQIDATDANTEWAEKVMPIAIMEHMIDLTHWQTFPEAGFLGPVSARHWSVMSTLSACISSKDISVWARANARHMLTTALISWLRLNLLWGNSGHDPVLICQCQNHVNMAVM